MIALQEVESLRLLDKFNGLLKKTEYQYKVVIESKDLRRINVAVMSKYPIISARTHREEPTTIPKKGKDWWPWLFSRDCLEVKIDVDGKPLMLYVNHFKSMLDKAKTEEEKRANTKPKRLEQAKRVAEIIDSEWREKNYEGNFVVLGDLNDYSGEGTALDPLLKHPGLVNVLGRLPAEEQWTHFYARKKEYKQLDYMLLSKSLAEKNPGNPGVMRMGLPLNAEEYTGPWFDNIGKEKPKASDHVPLYMDINLE